MSPSQQENVEQVVLDVLEDLLGKPFPLFGKERKPVQPSDSLVKDLKISSDDLSLVFVPTVEERLGVHVRVEDWSNVYTVQDAINLLRRYKDEKPTR